jgi:hypothetical protein
MIFEEYINLPPQGVQKEMIMGIVDFFNGFYFNISHIDKYLPLKSSKM